MEDKELNPIIVKQMINKKQLQLWASMGRLGLLEREIDIKEIELKYTRDKYGALSIDIPILDAELQALKRCL